MQKYLSKVTKLTRITRLNFYLPKQKELLYTDEFKTRPNLDGTLQETKDTSTIQDFDDKYGLEEVRDYKTILNHLKSTQQNYPLNDLIYFLRHLTQLSDDKLISNRDLISNIDFKGLVSHVKQKLKSGQHEKYPYLGSYAYCFKQLNVTDKELWLILEEKVLNDEYYTNFKESVYAVQGFTQLPQTLYGRDDQHIQDRIDKLYSKLERIVRLTIWEVDPKYYEKIATSLSQVNRFNKETFDKLEQHIMTNLDLNYETRTMVDILLAFSKGKQGSAEFYNAIQYVIFKGHMFNRNPFLKTQIQIQHDGYVVSGLMAIYNEVLQKHSEFQLNPNFSSLVHQVIVSKRTNFDLTSSIRTLTLLPMFQFEDNNLIVQHIFSRIMAYDGGMTVQEMLNFYKFIELKHDIERDGIPYKIFGKIEDHFLKNSNHYKTDEVWELYDYLFQRPNFIINNTEIQSKLIQIIDDKLLEMSSNEIEKFQSIFEKNIQPTIQQQILPPSQSKKSFLDHFWPSTKHSKQLEQIHQEPITHQYKQTVKKLEDIKIIQRYQETLMLQLIQKSEQP